MVYSHVPSSWWIEGNSIIQAPEDVTTMLTLASKGWGAKRIARELGCSKNTVKRYLRQGGWKPYTGPNRLPILAEMTDWLKDKFRQHAGNADVIRQDLHKERGISVCLRTVERAVAGLRRELRVEAEATVRFETSPGHQLQIDFGSKTVLIGGEPVRVFVFVATLGYSRRLYVESFLHERQSAWFQGMEGAFRHFGGVTREVLVDNAPPLVKSHNRKTGEVVFNDRFLAFAKHWGFTPRACAPFRAQTKGKDERGVGYVKKNALAGHEFVSLEALAAHLPAWVREVADERQHGTTGEPPRQRFERDECNALSEIVGKPTFLLVQEVRRGVANDSFVDYQTNRYSVPWRLIGECVTVIADGGAISILHAGQVVATHSALAGRFGVSREPEHFVGIFRSHRDQADPSPPLDPLPIHELLRPLSEYEAAAGGRW